MTAADCLFCKIVQGTIPATIVSEDKDFIAFRDIDPRAPTHVLVIPRLHITSLNEANDSALMGKLLMFARAIANAEKVSESGYRVVLNTNADGGQSVFHLHAHVMGGRPLGWPPG